MLKNIVLFFVLAPYVFVFSQTGKNLPVAPKANGAGGAQSQASGEMLGREFLLPPDALHLPGEESMDKQVEVGREYEAVFSQPSWVAPSPSLNSLALAQASNNNVAITAHNGRLFMAWRTGPIHFASKKTVMQVVSSADGGRNWELEHSIAIGRDIREPFFLTVGGKLIFYYMEAGQSASAFEPRGTKAIVYAGPGQWSQPVSIGAPGEIIWEMKVRNGKAWATSYKGNHYAWAEQSRIELYFKESTDGLNWENVDSSQPFVYQGGVSEAAFEFARDGSLWAVTRNEDGDATGWGSHVATAQPGAPGRWDFPQTSDPDRYDSPRMFRHGDEIYMIARRDIGGPFDRGGRNLPFWLQRARNMLGYSWRAKRTALYKIDRKTKSVALIADLPSAGDTAFPSIMRLGPHDFLIANYTSPLDRPNSSWIRGQISSMGTSIYFIRLTFRPKVKS
ncbi:MAG: hypothetical protein HYT79_05620 [Elusimicrobia bacterium]|nr:hypothetical protein [Elusimicrobiota bacterium]